MVQFVSHAGGGEDVINVWGFARRVSVSLKDYLGGEFINPFCHFLDGTGTDSVLLAQGFGRRVRRHFFGGETGATYTYLAFGHLLDGHLGHLLVGLGLGAVVEWGHLVLFGWDVFEFYRGLGRVVGHWLLGHDWG